MLYYIYVIVIYDGVCMGDLLNILCGDVFLTLMKTWLTLCQQVVEVHEDGYKHLMEEGGTYGALGVLWGHLWGIFSSGGGIVKMDGLYVWVKKCG